MAKSSSPFSFLWQALLHPSKNPKLFSNIFLIFIICYGFLYAGFQLSIAPLVSKVTELTKLLPTIDPTSPEYTEILNTFMAVTKELLVFEIVYYVFVFVVSTSLAIITYYANSTTFLGEILTLKEVLNKVKGIIRGPFITQLFAVLFTFLYLILFAVICSAISWYVSINSKISIMFFLSPLVLLATLILATLSWSMGVAISVIEPNVYGISAIMHGTRLLKGKKKQVFLLIFALCIASGIIYAFSAVTMMFASGSKAGILVMGFVRQLLQQVKAPFWTIFSGCRLCQFSLQIKYSPQIHIHL
jgi:hypothetical protein